MSLLALPEELLTNVLAVLPNAVFEGSCRAVCRRWRDLKSSSAFRAARREVDERVLVVTGWEDGNSYTVLENFALINGQWRKMAMSEVGVIGGAAVQFRGELVIVGWCEAPDWSYFFPPDVGRRPPNLEYTGVAFDVKSNCWRRLDWPLYDYKVVVAATSNDDLIVVLSGQSFQPWGEPDDVKYKLRYHKHDGDEWLELPLPPHELGMRDTWPSPTSLCCIGDVLYVPGGMIDEDIDDPRPPASSMLQALDLKTLEWTVCQPMPEQRCQCVTVTVAGKLFVLGGYSEYVYERYGDDALRSVRSFDPRTGTWRAEPDIPDLRTGRLHRGFCEGMSAVAHGHSVCVFGIEGSPPLALTNGVWTVLPRLPELDLGYPTNCPSGDEKPLLASLPLDGFAENVAPSSAAADDASESSHDGCWQPAGELPSDDDSEEGDSTDSDGDDEDDEDGTAL